MRANRIKALRVLQSPPPYQRAAFDYCLNRLNRAFTVDAPNKTWVTDITYIQTWQGWLYLAAVLDLYARKLVDWSMKPTLAKELALDALLMAVWRRKPKHKVIIHADQSSPTWQ